MKKGVTLLIVATLALSCVLVYTTPTTTAAAAPAPPAGKTVLFITGYGMGNKLLSNITVWLTSLGHTVLNATAINSTVLASVDALILASPYGATGAVGFNSTNAPAIRTAISNWFALGNKFLWVSGDSDYYDGTNGDWIAMNCSAILQAVGSYLRFEPMSVEDSQSNCGGSAYRLAANITVANTADGAEITHNVTYPVLFHGPTCIYGIDPVSGSPVALENVTIPSVFNIMRSSYASKVLDSEPTHTGAVHVAGRYSSYVMFAGEKYAGPYYNNKILASGGSPYGDYQPMWTNVYYTKQLNGSMLVKNALVWGLTSESNPGPNAPTLGALGTSTTGSFTATWGAIRDARGVLCPKYQLQMSDTSGFADILGEWNVTTGTSRSFAGYTDGTYYFRIRSVDALGAASSWSSTATLVVAIPTAPVLSPPLQAALIVLAILLFMLPLAYFLFTEKKK